MTLRWSPLVALAFVVAVAACGITEQARPVHIASDDLPSALRPGTDAGATPTSAGAATRHVEVFFVGQGGLQGFGRDVSADGSILAALLDALRRGPTREEAALGVRSTVDRDSAIEGTRIENGVALVDLPDALVSAPAAEQTVTLAQVVFSATSLPEVSAVRFTFQHRAVAVPRADGTLTREAVTRADYRSVVVDRPAA